jgi:phage-related baseplate assembly protein
MTVTNSQSSSGASDFESLDSARLRYPAAFKALRRAVTLGDWEALSKMVPGVMQAKAIDINIDPSLAHFFVKVYVIGNGGVISEALNTAVAEELKLKRVNATIFQVLSPTPVDVDVDINIYVARAYSVSNVQSAVISTIEDFFTMTSSSNSEVKLGQGVRLSRLTARIQSVPGLQSFNYVVPTGDLFVSAYEYIKLNTVKVTVGGTV